jgi:hypothetical protein
MTQNGNGTSIPKYLELMYDENDERNAHDNMCEAPMNYNKSRSSSCGDKHQFSDDGYEIPISFDNNNELDINANNELNSNLSKSRTLSNSSTVSHKSDQLQNQNNNNNKNNSNSSNNQIIAIQLENCKRSSLILDRDHKIYPKILTNGSITHQSGWV